jgi:FlaA1/EpsC-like NDP-sugar epimerase
MNKLKDFYLNKKILITGGTGSLGKELIKQLNKYTKNITCK